MLERFSCTASDNKDKCKGKLTVCSGRILCILANVVDHVHTAHSILYILYTAEAVWLVLILTFCSSTTLYFCSSLLLLLYQVLWSAIRLAAMWDSGVPASLPLLPSVLISSSSLLMLSELQHTHNVYWIHNIQSHALRGHRPKACNICVFLCSTLTFVWISGTVCSQWRRDSSHQAPPLSDRNCQVKMRISA